MVAASKCEGWALQKNYLVPCEVGIFDAQDQK